MDEQNAPTSSNGKVAMTFSSIRDEGPSTSKRARLMSDSQAGSSRDDDDSFQNGPSQSRSTENSRHNRESSDSDSSGSSSEIAPKVYATVEAYLESIPQFDESEHRQIPAYMEILGDNARHIQTSLPTSNFYTDEEMEVLNRNFILSQLDFLIRENFRRTCKENRMKGSGPFSLMTPRLLNLVKKTPTGKENRKKESESSSSSKKPVAVKTTTKVNRKEEPEPTSSSKKPVAAQPTGKVNRKKEPEPSNSSKKPVAVMPTGKENRKKESETSNSSKKPVAVMPANKVNRTKESIPSNSSKKPLSVMPNEHGPRSE